MANVRSEEGPVVFGQAFRVTIEIADLNHYLNDSNLMEYLDHFGSNMAGILDKNKMQLSLRDPISEGFVYGPND